MKKGKYINVGPHADGIPVDDTACDFGLDTVQEYFEKICELLKSSKPNYAWGRGGNVPPGGWLINNEVPSNRVGLPFDLAQGKLERLWVGNEDVNTFSVSLYEHDGDETGLSILVTVTVTASRSDFFDTADFGTINVTQGKQLGVRIATTSVGSAKNPEVFAQLSGNGG